MYPDETVTIFPREWIRSGRAFPAQALLGLHRKQQLSTPANRRQSVCIFENRGNLGLPCRRVSLMESCVIYLSSFGWRFRQSRALVLAVKWTGSPGLTEYCNLASASRACSWADEAVFAAATNAEAC